MQTHNLYNILFKNIEKNFNNTAFHIPNREDLSYKDFQKLVNIIYINLIKKNLLPGDRICVQTEKSVEVIALYIACLKLGAIYIPLNSDYSNDELVYFIEDSKPTLFIIDKNNKFNDDSNLKKNSNFVSIENLSLEKNDINYSQENEDVFIAKPDDIAAILYTSGTTGKPKGAMLSHQNLSSNCLTLSKIWEFSKNDVLLHALPIYHVHGLFVAINCSLINGSKILFLPKFEINKIIEYIPSSTVMMGVPTFFNRLIDSEKLNKNLCNNIRVFISGSAPLTIETWTNFYKKTGHKILERYGMTETGMISSNPYYKDGRKPETVGWALPDVKVKINKDKSMLNNQIGEIQVKGPNVFLGYWNRKIEDKKNDFTDDNFFKTGDLGRIDDEGRISIVGRHKDLIITGGLNVYPKEIEDRLNELKGIRESAVIGIPNKDFGESVIAVLVMEENKNLSPNHILDKLKAKLARFKIPKKIIFLDELPRNIMGKIQKNILRNMFKNTKL